MEVYKVVNLINNKIYVGITNQGYLTRWYKHCSDANTGSTFALHNSIRKYGKENFTIEVIENIDDVEVLKEREIFWIKFYNSYDRKIGYNLTLGGDGGLGRRISEETKILLRQSRIGKKHTEETKRKMKEAKKKEVFYPEEMSRRASIGNKNRWSNPENKLKQSLNSPYSKSILQYSINNEFIQRFHSVSEAARHIHKTHGNIARCARGELKSAYGFIWKYE